MLGYHEKLDEILEITKQMRVDQKYAMTLYKKYEKENSECENEEKDFFLKLEHIKEHLNYMHDDITKIDMHKAEKIVENQQMLANQLEYMMKEFKGILEMNVKNASKGSKRQKKSS